MVAGGLKNHFSTPTVEMKKKINSVALAECRDQNKDRLSPLIHLEWFLSLNCFQLFQ